MAQTQTPTTDPTDPYAVIRQRVRTQVAGADPTSPTSAPLSSTPASPDQLDPTNAAANTPGDLGSTAPAPPSPTAGQPLPNLDPGAATSLPSSYSSAPADPQVASLVAGWIKNNNLQANQSDPNALHSIVQYLRQQGINAQVDAADQNGHTGGILVNGQPYQLIDGSNNWTPLQPWQASGGSAGGSLAAPSNPFLDQLKTMLMSRIQADSAPVNESDPNIAAPLQAARDEASRTTDQERTALAERLYAQGDLNTNALTQGIQQSAEKNAGTLGTLRGNLIAQAYTQKLNDLQQAYQLAVSAGDADEARQIQLELAQLQATVQREGIGANLAISAAGQNANTVTAAGGGQ